MGQAPGSEKGRGVGIFLQRGMSEGLGWWRQSALFPTAEEEGVEGGSWQGGEKGHGQLRYSEAGTSLVEYSAQGGSTEEVQLPIRRDAEPG